MGSVVRAIPSNLNLILLEFEAQHPEPLNPEAQGLSLILHLELKSPKP